MRSNYLANASNVSLKAPCQKELGLRHVHLDVYKDSCQAVIKGKGLLGQNVTPRAVTGYTVTLDNETRRLECVPECAQGCVCV